MLRVCDRSKTFFSRLEVLVRDQKRSTYNCVPIIHTGGTGDLKPQQESRERFEGSLFGREFLVTHFIVGCRRICTN
jgi:hypothetical protein